MRIGISIFLAGVVLLSLSACGGSGSGSSANDSPSPPPDSAANLSLVAQVGEKEFFDQTLSSSGRMSCATCHDPDYAYGPPNDLAVQLGGPDLMTPGTRPPPSLRYKTVTPPYSDILANPDSVSLPSPGGGFTWDGRALTQAAQTSIPLLSANEMDNASPADVVSKIQASSYAALFMQAFGPQAFNDPDQAFSDAQAALQAYQQEDPSFNLFSSKFDLYQNNKIGGTLTAAEQRGLTVFLDTNTGNCNACHYVGAGYNGTTALFTDFSFEAIGVPRNPEIPANADPDYYDMGLCGPLRTDHLPASPGAPDSFCGMFKTPTLRNVATRTTFFHNGVMHSLKQVVEFYNTRDTMPQIWYPTMGGTVLNPGDSGYDPNFPTYGLITTQYAGGTVEKFNDLPAPYQANLDTQLPLDGRPAGSAPPMTDQQVSDLVCFLQTLTDDYQPPKTPPVSGTCVN